MNFDVMLPRELLDDVIEPNEAFDLQVFPFCPM